MQEDYYPDDILFLSISPWSIGYFNFLEIYVSISPHLFYIFIKTIKINKHQWRKADSNYINHHHHYQPSTNGNLFVVIIIIFCSFLETSPSPTPQKSTVISQIGGGKGTDER